jgi:hypothetical protein
MQWKNGGLSMIGTTLKRDVHDAVTEERLDLRRERRRQLRSQWSMPRALRRDPLPPLLDQQRDQIVRRHATLPDRENVPVNVPATGQNQAKTSLRHPTSK